jgi:multicomponent Na+:H+ antiporter subunit E
MRRYLAYVVALAIAWVMLWDQVTLANFLGGIAVAAVLLAVFPLPPVAPARRLNVRPLALGRLAADVLRELVVSNVFMTREIVTPQRRLVSGVVRCPMRTDSPKLLSTIANIIALSPGMMAVDSTDGPPVLFVHVLTEQDLHDVRRRVARLERLVIEAIGSAADRRALSRGVGEL